MWVLIIICLSGRMSVDTIGVVEFTSREKCQDAGNKVHFFDQTDKFICVEK